MAKIGSGAFRLRRTVSSLSAIGLLFGWKSEGGGVAVGKHDQGDLYLSVRGAGILDAILDYGPRLICRIKPEVDRVAADPSVNQDDLGSNPGISRRQFLEGAEDDARVGNSHSQEHHFPAGSMAPAAFRG